MRVRLKGLKQSAFTLADGTRVKYFYAWRPDGPRLNYPDGTPITDKTDPALVVAYTKAHDDAKRNGGAGKLSTLIAAFKIANEFTKLAAETKKGYLKYLARIDAKFGSMPFRALQDRRARGQFKDWRDEIAAESGDRTADFTWTVLARVLSVAKDRGKISVNVCERGGRLYDGERSDRVWTEADEAKYFTKANAHMHLPLLIALWTGQREGDILKLNWMQYDGKYIRLEQSKGRRGKKKRLVIPVGEPLRMALDALKAAEMEDNGGRPLDGIICKTMRAHNAKRQFTEDGFRTSFGKECAKAGIEDLTFHDARGTAITRLAIAGCEVPEIATITGHSLKTVQEILDKHYLNRDVRMAENAIMKLEVSKGIVRVSSFQVVAGGRA
jgi:integrase